MKFFMKFSFSKTVRFDPFEGKRLFYLENEMKGDWDSAL